MALLVLALVVCLALTVAIGFLAHRIGRSVAGGPYAWGAAVAARAGHLPGALLCLVVGGAISVALTLAFGPVARSLQSSIDTPVYNAVNSRVTLPDDSRYGQFIAHYTALGDRGVAESLVIIATIVLGVIYGRRWYIPVVLLLGTAFIQYEAQIRIDAIIDRTAPPIPMSGTYPSGGVSRLTTVFGTVAVLVVLIVAPLSRAWLARIWTGVMFFGVLEAYTRVYLSQHWLTDALGGLLLGGLLTVTAQTCAGAVGPIRLSRASPVDRPRADAASSAASSPQAV